MLVVIEILPQAGSAVAYAVHGLLQAAPNGAILPALAGAGERGCSGFRAAADTECVSHQFREISDMT
ncbi:MAG: hypothetical protein ACE5ET_07795, partial [Gammaproteobacteria bacterium]